MSSEELKEILYVYQRRVRGSDLFSSKFPFVPFCLQIMCREMSTGISFKQGGKPTQWTVGDCGLGGILDLSLWSHLVTPGHI